MPPNQTIATTDGVSTLLFSGQASQEPARARPIRAKRNPGISKEVLVALRSKTGASFQSRAFRCKPLTYAVRNVITGFLTACQKDPTKLRIAGVKWDRKLVATQLYNLFKSSPSGGRPVRKADVETWLGKSPYAQMVNEILVQVKESATAWMAQAAIPNDASMNMDMDDDLPPAQATVDAPLPEGDYLLNASRPSDEGSSDVGPLPSDDEGPLDLRFSPADEGASDFQPPPSDEETSDLQPPPSDEGPSEFQPAPSDEGASDLQPPPSDEGPSDLGSPPSDEGLTEFQPAPSDEGITTSPGPSTSRQGCTSAYREGTHMTDMIKSKEEETSSGNQIPQTAIHLTV